VTTATIGEPADEVASVAASPDALAILRPTAPNGEQIPVRTGTFTIGRRAGNDFVISTDPYVSGAHAMLTCDANGCYLTDVGSTNGTSVNGTRLDSNARQLLLDGDEVMIGQTSYRFETVAAPAEDTPEEAEAGPEPDDLAAVEETGAAQDQVVS
jgi:pSer/pThr/pTyr-binding forkhead associated (FHA) protein